MNIHPTFHNRSESLDQIMRKFLVISCMELIQISSQRDYFILFHYRAYKYHLSVVFTFIYVKKVLQFFLRVFAKNVMIRDHTRRRVRSHVQNPKDGREIARANITAQHVVTRAN